MINPVVVGMEINAQHSCQFCSPYFSGRIFLALVPHGGKLEGEKKEKGG